MTRRNRQQPPEVFYHVTYGQRLKPEGCVWYHQRIMRPVWVAFRDEYSQQQMQHYQNVAMNFAWADEKDRDILRPRLEQLRTLVQELVDARPIIR